MSPQNPDDKEEESVVDAEQQESETTIDEKQADILDDKISDVLSREHVWNLVFCLLAWGFTVANVTMVIGTSAVLILSLGGGNQITSMPLGTFFLGSSIVSLTLTPWIFPLWGRKRGFLTGIALGLIGSALGAISVKASSPGLYILSTVFFGMATGIGYALRFAVVEVVPKRWGSRAVTLVVSGGVLAAFVGPEAAAATKDIFGDELTYMGVFLMTTVFNICNILCTAVVTFPDKGGLRHKLADGQDALASTSSQSMSWTELVEMLYSRNFVIPMLVASLCWATMGMPMSMVRVVMKQLGYTATDSLRVIELHFVGMYAPGFFTGNLIQRWGPKCVCYLAVVVSAVAQAIAFLPNEDEDESILFWSLGLVLVGVGWNFAFTASTVWLLQKGRPDRKNALQAANDCLMFLLAGGWLFASSYIFEAGGSQLDGWYTLNFVVVGLLLFMTILLALDSIMERCSQVN